jgi:uncharacterized membrane protein
MLDRNLILDILFAIVFIYYGYKYRYLTPTFEGQKGITTPRAKLNKENWKMGHEFAGTICFIYAFVFLVLFAVKNFFIGYGTWLDKIQLVVELLCVLSIPILVEQKLKKDGNNEGLEDSKEKEVLGLRDMRRMQRGEDITKNKSKNKKKNGKKKKK